MSGALGNIVLSSDDHLVRLVTRLWWNHDLVKSPTTAIGNYRDATGEVIQTLLALADTIGIHSVPGNEWERFHELRRQCHLTEALLLTQPEMDRDIIRDSCDEAIEQLVYLMAFWSIRWAAAIETLCLNEKKVGDTWSTKPM